MLIGGHSPGYVARGTAVGIFLTFTPSVGFQVPLLMGVWTLTRLLAPRQDFHFAVAFGWTLLSNWFTLPPLYYLFWITGRVLLGQWGQPAGFDSFSNRLEAALNPEQGLWDSLTGLADHLAGDLLWPLLLGCLPWAVAGSLAGHWLTLRFLERRRVGRGR